MCLIPALENPPFVGRIANPSYTFAGERIRQAIRAPPGPSDAIHRTELTAVNNYLRVIPYLWPHRRKVFLSMAFALLVALLWSLNLTAVYPVMKVLGKSQTLQQYVEKEIALANAEIEERTARIKEYDDRLQRLERQSSYSVSDRKVEVLKDQARQQAKLSAVSRKALVMNWIKVHVVPRLPGDQFDLLAIILLLLLIATLIKGFCIWMQDVLVGSVVELTTMTLRKQCFRHALTLDYQTVAGKGSSDIMSRFTYDMALLSTGLTLFGGKIVREPLKALCCIIAAFLVCWQLTALSLLFVPLVVLFFYRIGKKLKHASHRLMESMSRIYKTLEETFEGLKIVIAFNGSRRHKQRFHRDNKHYFSKAMKIIKIDALTSPTTEVLGLLAAFIALLPGAYLVLRDTKEIWGITLTSNVMDFEELALLYALLAGVIDPVRKLSSTYAKLKRAAAAADRVFELIDTQPLVREPADPLPLPETVQRVDFHDVSFSYLGRLGESAARGPALHNVSLSARQGDVVVVVGENGSGKSTLVNLLPRYYDPDHGAVLIDGIDIRDAALAELRSRIGVVTQETLLFDESITENIRYGKPHATAEEIERAARRAHVHAFVSEVPEGYDTVVGEKGQRFSGGQRQRIALARAMIRDPSILILDEATSAIDAQSEQLIHEALRSFSRGRITFIITHSVSRSILDFVTAIAVMDQGKLIACGSHDELIAACPVYQKLYHAHTERKTARPEPAANPGSAHPASQQKPAAPGSAPATGPHIIPLRSESADRRGDGTSEVAR